MINHGNKIISDENLAGYFIRNTVTEEGESKEELVSATIIIENDYLIQNCNLSQKKAHTEILKGITGLTFKGCNLKNCDLPSDAIIIDCLVCHEDIIDESNMVPDIKKIAMQKFEEIKPLAYEDPVAVNDALNTVYTPEEINGVLSARVE